MRSYEKWKNSQTICQEISLTPLSLECCVWGISTAAVSHIAGEAATELWTEFVCIFCSALSLLVWVENPRGLFNKGATSLTVETLGTGHQPPLLCLRCCSLQQLCQHQLSQQQIVIKLQMAFECGKQHVHGTSTPWITTLMPSFLWSWACPSSTQMQWASQFEKPARSLLSPSMSPSESPSEQSSISVLWQILSLCLVVHNHHRIDMCALSFAVDRIFSVVVIVTLKRCICATGTSSHYC